MGLFGLGATREQKFWTWFERNSGRLRDFESDQDRVFTELGAALGKVSKDLTFEFGPAGPTRQFVVSADGIRSVFPAVEALIAAAPQIEGWRLLAFRQPGSPDVTIRFGDAKLGQDDVWFSAAQGSGLTDITLHVRGLTADNEQLLKGAVFILLDNLLGEYVAATEVGAIEWATLPDDPGTAGLSPFADMRSVFGLAGESLAAD